MGGEGRSRGAHRAHPAAGDYSRTVLSRASWPDELDTVRALFRGYREWLADHAPPGGPSEGLADIDRLITELPGAYGPPRGDVILARKESAIVACGALREWAPTIGEIKRIFVRGDHQGPGFGPVLTGALLARAREFGFRTVRVDTLASMAGAIQFYRKMGFVPIPAYWPHPVPEARFFEWTAPSGAPKRPG